MCLSYDGIQELKYTIDAVLLDENNYKEITAHHFNLSPSHQVPSKVALEFTEIDPEDKSQYGSKFLSTAKNRPAMKDVFITSQGSKYNMRVFVNQIILPILFIDTYKTSDYVGGSSRKYEIEKFNKTFNTSFAYKPNEQSLETLKLIDSFLTDFTKNYLADLANKNEKLLFNAFKTEYQNLHKLTLQKLIHDELEQNYKIYSVRTSNSIGIEFHVGINTMSQSIHKIMVENVNYPITSPKYKEKSLPKITFSDSNTKDTLVLTFHDDVSPNNKDLQQHIANAVTKANLKLKNCRKFYVLAKSIMDQ